MSDLEIGPGLGARKQPAPPLLRELIQVFVERLEDADKDVLVAQVSAIADLQAAGPRMWQIVLSPCARSKLPDGCLDMGVPYRTDADALAGEMLLWVRHGRLSRVELPWFTDTMPEELPRLDQLLL